MLGTWHSPALSGGSGGPGPRGSEFTGPGLGLVLGVAGGTQVPLKGGWWELVVWEEEQGIRAQGQSRERPGALPGKNSFPSPLVKLVSRELQATHCHNLQSLPLLCEGHKETHRKTLHSR